MNDEADHCDTSFAPELLQSLKSFPECVLDFVLGVAAIPDYQRGAFQTGAAMALEEFPEGLHVSIACGRDQHVLWYRERVCLIGTFGAIAPGILSLTMISVTQWLKHAQPERNRHSIRQLNLHIFRINDLREGNEFEQDQ